MRLDWIRISVLATAISSVWVVSANAVTINVTPASFSAARANGVEDSGFGVPPASRSASSGGTTSQSDFDLQGIGGPVAGGLLRTDFLHHEEGLNPNTGGFTFLRFTVSQDVEYSLDFSYTADGGADAVNASLGVSLVDLGGPNPFSQNASTNLVGITTFVPTGPGTIGTLLGGHTYDFNASFIISALNADGAGFAELRFGDLAITGTPAPALGMWGVAAAMTLLLASLRLVRKRA